MNRQFHIVLQSILKINKHDTKQLDQSTSFAEDNKWKWFKVIYINIPYSFDDVDFLFIY